APPSGLTPRRRPGAPGRRGWTISTCSRIRSTPSRIAFAAPSRTWHKPASSRAASVSAALVAAVSSHHHVHGRPAPEPEVALSRAGPVVTRRHLEVVLSDLLVPQQLVGAGREDADRGAGGTHVARQAHQIDVQEVPRRQVVVVDLERPRREGLVVADDVD